MDENGNLIWTYQGITLGRGGVRNNPLTFLKNTYYIQNDNLTSNLLLGYEIIEGLSAKASFGFNSFYNTEYFGNPKSAQNPVFNTQATASFGKNNYLTWIIEPQVEYNKVKARNRFNVLVGATLQRNNNERTLINGSGYINDDLIGSITAAATKNVTDGFSEYKYAALFARLNYRFDNKYLVNLTARRDGSSRFGPGRQFGNFGAVGLGWLFGEEEFIKNLIPALSYGKIRGSYGVTGSDGISDYQYLSRWSASNYNYDGVSGYIPQNLFNPVLNWASTKKTEVGLELGFLQDKVLLNATYYRNRSGNQLVTYPLPSITGFASVASNLDALIQNSGLELMLQSDNIKISDGFSWTSSFNITLPQNKLISFPDLETSSYNFTYAVGHSTNTIFGFRYAGVNEETGIFQFYDEEGNLTSNPRLPSSGRFNDFQIIGNLDPKFYGGFLNSFSYKNFQLDIFFDFRKQMGVNYLRQVYSFTPGFEMNLPAALLDRWQKPGDRTDIQKFSTQYSDVNTASSRFVHSSAVHSDASYIRLRNISLSYSFGDILKSKIKAKNLRVFCNAQNLLTITNYLGNDPETQSLYGMPTLKTIVLGLQLTL
jgi:TonB-linked SusC/RagA family outer membrane protein